MFTALIDSSGQFSRRARSIRGCAPKFPRHRSLRLHQVILGCARSSAIRAPTILASVQGCLAGHSLSSLECGLTIRSTGSRFAAPVNSSVRPQQIKSVRRGFRRVPACSLRSLIPPASFSRRARSIRGCAPSSKTPKSPTPSRDSRMRSEFCYPRPDDPGFGPRLSCWALAFLARVRPNNSFNRKPLRGSG